MPKPILVAGLCALVCAATPNGGRAAVVAVDCNSPGRSIQRVLDRVGDDSPLRIEVAGTCMENVVVARDEVELVGVAPGAGIRAPGGDRSSNPLSVLNANHILVSGLTLSGGHVAMDVVDSGDDIRVAASTFSDNDHGLEARRSTVRLDATVLVSDFNALSLVEFSNVRCVGCDLEGGDLPVFIDHHSTLVLVESTAVHTFGSSAAVCFASSVLDLRDSHLDGGVQAGTGCRALVQRGSSLAGSAFALSELASGFIDSESSATQLFCSVGADVWCEPGAVIGFSNCAACPASP